ncbi:uncharacterized protein LOC101455605 [Ceratitis capitata]|nr:uncharacterized protein LOC101455605 [Ceratitis capitata]
MKAAVQICLLFAFFTITYAASSTWGVRNATADVPIVSRNVFLPAKNVSQTVYFDIPETNQSNSKVISVIYLQDQFKNSSGPTNFLYYGGPGWTFASVQMKTIANYGLNVTFVVYGI